MVCLFLCWGIDKNLAIEYTTSMKPKKIKLEEIELLKKRAIELWKLNYTTRQISVMMGKVRTHAWVHNVVKNIPVDKLG